MPLDEIDGMILSELQANGRLTMKSLAEKVGLSSPAMIERVKRLEDRGVITGYRAMIAPEAIGLDLTAFITVSPLDGAGASLLELLEKDPAVEECHRLTGDWPYLLKVHLADSRELEALVDRMEAANCRCSAQVVLSTPIPDRQLLVIQPNRPRSGRSPRRNPNRPS